MLPPDLISTLGECSKHDFAGARHLWFSRQLWSSVAVIVGLILEFPELRYDILSIARSRIQRYRYRIVILEHRVELARIAAFVGWLFIVGGLLGELKTSAKIEDLSASIQECSDAKVRAATLEAGDAADSAKIAHAEADSVKGIADAARADAKDALVKAQAAQRELANAEDDSAKAQAAASRALGTAEKVESHLAEVAKRANELAEKIKFRHVSSEQARKIKSALLASASGGIEIEVRPNADDGDVYCRELWDAIHGGGWTGSFGMMTLLYSEAHDLVLIMKDPDNAPSRAGTLRNALKSADINVLIGRDPRLRGDDLILLVAPKPK